MVFRLEVVAVDAAVVAVDAAMVAVVAEVALVLEAAVEEVEAAVVAEVEGGGRVACLGAIKNQRRIFILKRQRHQIWLRASSTSSLSWSLESVVVVIVVVVVVVVSFTVVVSVVVSSNVSVGHVPVS